MESEPLIGPASSSPSSLAFSDRFKNYNWKNTFTKWTFVARALIILFMVSMSIANAQTGMVLPFHDTECLWDGVFDATAGINSFLTENEGYRNALLILSSLLIDLLMVSSALRFMFFAKTWRSLMFLVSFYSVRGLILGMFLMRFPEGRIFDDPGFPSLTITYAKTSDFFFSGHVGFATFSVLENRYYKNFPLMVTAIFTVLLESFTLTVTRAHYSIDIISGVVFAHYIWIVTGWAAPYVDRKLIQASKRRPDEYIRLN